MLFATRRKDQRGFKPGMSCPNQIIGGVVVCETWAGVDAWIVRLNKRHPLRFNHFVRFCNAPGGKPALQFGHAEWANVDAPYILR